jgi:hypothetical protein
MKGRDAYAFDPVVSKYLLRHEDRLEVQTPYSRTVVDEMRQVPFASWDAERHVWTVPYRSYEDLRRRWERIEAAARRNEPDERKKRQAEKRGSEEERVARARALERRRRRYPVQADDLPPLERPVMTSRYGMVVFLGSDGEPTEEEVLSSFYPEIPITGDYVWAQWRPAQFDELIRTWPSRLGSKGRREGATWWPPTIEELRIARKAARRSERRQDRSSPTLPIDGIARPE